MSAITITITITPNSTLPTYQEGVTLRANNGYWISVDDDQADLTNVGHGGGHGNNSAAHINWIIDTSGWEFPATGGIAFRSPGNNFTDKLRDSSNKQQHRWQREFKDNFSDLNDIRYWYKYTIMVTNATGTIVIADPWVINR